MAAYEECGERTVSFFQLEMRDDYFIEEKKRHSMGTQMAFFSRDSVGIEKCKEKKKQMLWIRMNMLGRKTFQQKGR